MFIGINHTPPHNSPEEWAEFLAQKGYHAASFPVDYTAPVQLIDAYVKAAKQNDIVIAEVGVWNSPHAPDRQQAEENRKICEEQLRLAEYIGACCCVNVSGAAGDIWYGCYAKNFTERLYAQNVEFIQHLCDSVQPEKTCFALEPMQWMLPDSPKQYKQLLQDVSRKGFGVHMDIVNMFKDPYTYTHKRELIDQAFTLLGDHIKSCHLKDCVLEPGATVSIKEVPLGEGTMDNAYYLSKIRQLSRPVPVLLEHLPDMAAYDKALQIAHRL